MKNTVSACPIEDVMRLLSGRWRTLLVYYLSDGPKRFSQLRRDNPTISHRMLTLNLRELEAAGVIFRTIYPSVPPRVDYALSEDGRRLVPLVNALGDWWEDIKQRPAAINSRESPQTGTGPSALS